MDDKRQQVAGTRKGVGGRPRRTDKPRDYSVYLPEDAAEWAKGEEGGLSGILSGLLTKEWDKRKRIAAAAAAIENEAD